MKLVDSLRNARPFGMNSCEGPMRKRPIRLRDAYRTAHFTVVPLWFRCGSSGETWGMWSLVAVGTVARCPGKEKKRLWLEERKVIEDGLTAVSTAVSMVSWEKQTHSL